MTELSALLKERQWRTYFPSWDAPNEVKLEAFRRFCAEVWTIRHPTDGRINLVLRDTQVATVRAWLDNRYTLVLKARQLGYSTLAAAYVFWATFGYRDRYIVMLSRTEREAVSLLGKVKYGLKAIPPWMLSRGPEVTDDAQQRITFANDSRIASFPSSNDPARGETVWGVVVDEWGFLPNAEEAWASIEPITDVGGWCIGISTANGWGNFFHQMWVGAEAGTSRFVPLFHPWDADGVRDDAWYAAKSADTPVWLMAQEYPSNPDEAFIKSGKTVFDVDSIQAMEDVEPRRGYLWARGKSFQFELMESGNLSVWAPPQEGKVYVIGADVAEGLDHGDFSCAFVLDATTGAVAACWHGHVDPDEFAGIVSDVGHWYNCALVAVESNNHGMTTLTSLHRDGYRRIFRQRRMGTKTENKTQSLGWRTTHVSKPVAIDGLGAWLRDHAVPCRATKAELRTYVRDGNGRTSGSPHDDRVMALAIAVQMLLWATVPEQRMDVPSDAGTFGWYMRQARNQARPHRPKPIGTHNVRKR